MSKDFVIGPPRPEKREVRAVNKRQLNMDILTKNVDQKYTEQNLVEKVGN